MTSSQILAFKPDAQVNMIWHPRWPPSTPVLKATRRLWYGGQSISLGPLCKGKSQDLSLGI